jgi:hypothetical protein
MAVSMADNRLRTPIVLVDLEAFRDWLAAQRYEPDQHQASRDYVTGWNHAVTRMIAEAPRFVAPQRRHVLTSDDISLSDPILESVQRRSRTASRRR